jgi:hypothetical protein
MILLNPIWLFALAALSIPVAIHLWNIRQGKTLKVGSISLITVASQKRSRSLKLHDLLLLLLRCLLLALLAFVLTMPLWQRQINPSTVKGWVLIPKENLKESYQKFKPKIDSLTKAGFEFHYFNKGFEKIKLSDVLADNKNLKVDSTRSASYWSLVQQLDGQIPASLPVYLFTPNRISNFSGERPKVALNLHWDTYIPTDSASTWIDRAWFINNNDIQVVKGNTNSTGTYYTNYTIQSGNQHNTPFIVNADNGKLTVGLKNTNVVTVDTSAWRFGIYVEKNTADAGYVKAALQSVVQFTKHKAVIKEYTDAAQMPAHQNWLFWLSSKPIDKQTAQNCNNLFSYESGKVKDMTSWINDQNESLSNPKIALYKSVAAANDHSYALWTDGFGNPVLSFEKQGQTNKYHFNSRFDPSWNDLVWSDDFPKMLLGLIVGQPVKPGVMHDFRAIDTRQLLPVTNNEAHTSIGKIIEHTDLAFYCWILLALVFITERWIAHKKAGKQVLQNG